MAKRPTDIEVIMAAELKDLGLKFKREFKVGYYPIDFYLPDYELSIQVDGTYYHGNCPDCLKEEKNNPRQVFQRRRDLACISFHKYHQVSIIRVCACKLLYDKKRVRKILKSCIKTIQKGEKIYYGRGEI